MALIWTPPPPPASALRTEFGAAIFATFTAPASQSRHPVSRHQVTADTKLPSAEHNHNSIAGYCLGVLNTCLDWMAADLGFQVARGGSVVVSAALVGASVGSISAGQFADSVGPGKALLYNNVLLLLGSVLCASTPGGILAAILGTNIISRLFPLPLNPPPPTL